MLKLNEKGIITQFALFIILLLGIFAGVYVANHRTQLFSKAAPVLPSSPEEAFVLELEKDVNPPLTDGPTPESITSGSKFRIDIYARSDIDPANLFVAHLKYPKDLVTVDSIDPRTGNSLVDSLVDTRINNETGELILAGTKSNPGVQTDIQHNYLFASVIFTTKKVGEAEISFGDKSAIFSNKDNLNVLGKKLGLTVSIKPETTLVPTPTPTLTPTPTVAPSVAPTAQPTPVVSSMPPTTEICSNILINGAVLTHDSANQDVYILTGAGTVRLNNSLSNTTTSWSGSGGTLSGTSGSTVSWTIPASSDDKNYTATAIVTNQGTNTNCQVKLIAKKPVSQPTPSPVSSPTNKTFRRDGDTNSDGKFDYVDLSVLLSQFNNTNVDTEADLNGDRVVNAIDRAKELEILNTKGVIHLGGNSGTATTSGNVISSCQEITKPGDYVLNQDVTAVKEQVSTYSTANLDKNYCIYVHDTSNVNIDCQNHQLIGHLRPTNASGSEDQPIGPIKFSNVNGLSLKSCTLVNAGPGQQYASVRDSKDGVIQNNILKDSILEVSGASNIKVNSNAVSGGVWLNYVTNSEINSNTFAGAKDSSTAISLSHGSNNKVINNKIDSRSTYSASFQGTRGILIDSESASSVESNQIGNNPTFALYIGSDLKNSKIINNKFINVNWAIMVGRVGTNSGANNSVLPPITNLTGNTISGNVADKSVFLYGVMYMFYSQGGVNTPGFKQDSDFVSFYGQNNTFNGNQLTNPFNGQQPTPVDF